MNKIQSLTIEPDFSVYDMVKWDSFLNIFSKDDRMLARWCYSVETEILNENYPVVIFAGFQELKNLLPVASRYRKLATVTKAIYVFGETYSEMPEIENVHYINLSSNHQLCLEWFLIVNTPGYSRALIAREKRTDKTTPSKRSFEGVFSSDKDFIVPIYEQLIQKFAYQEN